MAHQDHQFDSQENTEQKYNLNAQVTLDKGSVKYVKKPNTVCPGATGHVVSCISRMCVMCVRPDNVIVTCLHMSFSVHSLYKQLMPRNVNITCRSGFAQTVMEI